MKLTNRLLPKGMLTQGGYDCESSQKCRDCEMFVKKKCRDCEMFVKKGAQVPTKHHEHVPLGQGLMLTYVPLYNLARVPKSHTMKDLCAGKI